MKKFMIAIALLIFVYGCGSGEVLPDRIRYIEETDRGDILVKEDVCFSFHWRLVDGKWRKFLSDGCVKL